MHRARSKFAGGDQNYLRDEQYADGSRLAARADVHVKYRTAPVSWFDWVVPRLGLSAGMRVLEAGCGTGWLWSESTVSIPVGVHLTLSDLSPGMVAEALQRVTSGGRFAAVEGYPADLQALPFADDTFDVVVANHMLYHLPDPAAGVGELARVANPAGRVIVATNGRRHMREMWQIRGEVFGVEPVDHTIDVFGVESGFPLLRDHFGQVTWRGYDDVLRITDPADVVNYICSTPPGEDATAEQLAALDDAIAQRFAAGNGLFAVTKDTGCFVCTEPLERALR